MNHNKYTIHFANGNTHSVYGFNVTDALLLGSAWAIINAFGREVNFIEERNVHGHYTVYDKFEIDIKCNLREN